VDGVDWEHVVEEIEDVGLSELNAVRGYLRQMLVQLRARAQLKGINYDGVSPGTWPDTCPFTLNDLLNEERTGLERRMKEAASVPQA
jgi:hypothetical protein